MKSYEVAIPRTRDPFVNAQLIPAGIDSETGEERFWATTWNGVSGCIGALVTPSGKNRIYRFNPEEKEFGFYGACYAGNDIMWMSCFLDSITKLDLKTGKTQTWQTGQPKELSCSGLVYDEASGKVFWATYCQCDLKRNGLVFDTKTETVSNVFKDIPLKNNQLRKAIKNIDGTYTFLNIVPNFELLWWDPKDDSIDVILESQFAGHNNGFMNYGVVIQRPDGAIYLPQYGWFDPLKRSFVDGPRPSSEAAWFGISGNYAYGAVNLQLGNASVYQWNMTTGESRFIAEVPDALLYSLQLTNTGKIVCINLYGFLYRVDAMTGAIETSVKLDTDAVGHIDCLYRIDEERLLCTPFITQRFYEINLETGKGVDLGRATGGVGEVLEVCKLHDKIYMASYTKGQMVEYDPSQPSHFPENPRIVINPPEMAMRPVAMCNDGNSIFYSCSHEYGSLGCMMLKHTPATGQTVILDYPLQNQMIRSLAFDKATNRLLATTTFHADCKSCVPTDDQCVLAVLDPDTLKPLKTIPFPKGHENTRIFGIMPSGSYLCGGTNMYAELWLGYQLYLFNPATLAFNEYTVPSYTDTRPLKRLYFAEQPGLFVLAFEDSIELWNLETGSKIHDICVNPGFYNAKVQDGCLYLISEKSIKIHEGIMPV